MASYPTSVKTFTTRNAGDVIQPSHVNDLQDEVNAVEAGLLTGPLTIGGQIKFPATQAPSADANTLDDYEEGTWAPVIGGAGGTTGQTYVSQNGLYVKIGKLVMVQFVVQLSAKGTITGNVQVQGLPFASLSGSGQAGCALIWGGLSTNWVSVGGVLTANSTALGIIGAAAAAADNATSLTTSDISDNAFFVGQMCYVASA